MKNVLLTTVQKPFGVENERIMPELFQGQVTHAQGIFSLRSVCHGWGLEFIAKNLKSPTTVLHYPSLKDFMKELKKGYDFVGINFVMATWQKAKELIDIVRRESPESKIVLGGYGTVLSEVDRYADYVCRGEGLAFMQDLLEETSVGRYKSPIVTTKMSCMSIPVGKSGILYAGLGCPNGCDFCCTTHFYKKKYIPLLKNGKDIYNAMMKYDQLVPDHTYSLIDEDFLYDKKRVEELYQYTSTELDRPRSFTCFASAKSIKQYDPEWLVELGVSTIWIGVESKIHKYKKTKDCNMEEIFDSLHKVGINTLGSMILGVDEHSTENIWDDIDYMISLKSSLTQFLIFTPCPTTPLWDRLETEGRLIKDYPLDKRDGFHLMHNHDNFSAVELEDIQGKAFDKEYRELGPSVLRYLEKCLNGYRYFADSEKPIHIARRRVFRETISRALPLFGTVIRNAPSSKVKTWARNLKAEILSEVDIKERLSASVMSAVVPLFASYTRFTQNYTKYHLQPRTLVNRYNYEEFKENKCLPIGRIALENV